MTKVKTMNNKPTILLAPTPFDSVRVWFKPESVSDEDKKFLIKVSLWGIDARDSSCGTVGVEVLNSYEEILPSLLSNLHFTKDSSEALKAWGVES